MAALRAGDGRSRAIGLVRLVLAAEALAFALASLVHRGWMAAGTLVGLFAVIRGFGPQRRPISSITL